MAENKTRATEVSVDAFLDAVDPPQRRDDGRAVAAMMERVTGEAPKMWGPSIVGYGVHRYKYESGREGEICRVGFSPRKAQLVFYIGRDYPEFDDLAGRLGKYESGKGCLYVRKLADVDMDVLETMVRKGWDAR